MHRNENESAATKADRWEERIKAWRESGLSQAEYCRRNRLTQNAFTYWKRKLSEDVAGEFVELPGGFEAPADEEPLVEIRLGQDLRLGLRFNLNLSRFTERL